MLHVETEYGIWEMLILMLGISFVTVWKTKCMS